MKQDTSISGLANKRGRKKITIFIIYPLRTVRALAMVSVGLTLLFRQRRIVACIREVLRVMSREEEGSEGGHLRRRRREAVGAFLPHALAALVTMLLVRLYPEEDWLPIALKEMFIVSSMVIEVHMAYGHSLVITALRTIKRRIASYYNNLTDGPKRQSLMLYLEDPYMTKSFEDGQSGVEDLRQTHMDLHDATHCLNACYSFASLFTTWACRAGIMVNVYYYLSRYQPGFLVSLLLNFIQLFMICYSSEKIQQEDNKLLQLLNDLDASPLGKRMRLEFKLFEQQIRQMKVEFNSFNLFSFNYQLIATMITTSMGYMILVKQMDA